MMAGPETQTEERGQLVTTDERLEKLEWKLAHAKRRNRWVLGAVALALGVWLVAGTFGPRTAGAQDGGAPVNEVRAKRLLLVDDAGKIRAMLTMTPAGPALVLYDAAGNPRVALDVNADGSGLALSDAAGKIRAVLRVDADGSGLALRDAAGKPRAGLTLTATGPALVLSDNGGKLRAGLGVLKDSPSLVLTDAAGKIRATVGAGSTALPDGTTTIYPESSLFLSGPDGKVIWQAP